MTSPTPALWSKRNILFSLAVILVLVIVSTGIILQSLNSSALPLKIAQATLTPQPTWQPPVSNTSHLIAQENAKAGSPGWQIDPYANDQFLQAYAGVTSALPGDAVPLYVSSETPAHYDLAVYRLGWYHGIGAHLYAKVANLASVDQGYWALGVGLKDCPTCVFTSGTDLLDAHWAVSYTLHIDQSWPTGVYVVQMNSTPYGVHAETYIPLVIRNDTSTSNVLVGLPVNTYQAYNWWGGYSLYTHIPNNAHSVTSTTEDHAQKISFNRPYARNNGTADLFSWDIQSIRWLERNAYDVSYVTSVDLTAHPENILNHRVFLSIGHDEYWTKAARDGVETARNRGVSLGFFGGNDVYWQVRLENDAANDPYRTLVCYKVQTNSTDVRYQLQHDPDYPSQMGLVTSEWRDPVLNRPENALLGAMYFNLIAESGPYRPDWVVSAENDPYLKGTGLAANQHISGGLLGYEYDSLADNGQTPAGLITIASSPVKDAHQVGVIHTAATTIYKAPSGALVFDAGSIWWGWGLDDVAFQGTEITNALGGNTAIQKLTANILNTMIGKQ